MSTLSPPEVRRATRDSQQPVIGGVAAGLARHLGLPVLWVRVGFVLAALLSGLGVVLYAALWLVLPSDSRFVEAAPGVESATRRGLRPGRIRRLGDMGPVIALAVLGFGLVLVVQAVLGSGSGGVLWPIFLGLVGVGLLWRQADEAQRERWLDTTGRIDPLRVVLGSRGWASYARLVAGVGLIVLALVAFSLRGGSITLARDITLSALLGVVGIAIVVGPWVYRLASDLTAERTERVRTQERADVAAHLHDSVLQTLALIQKNAGDAPTVARLARAQERDLRAWLYAGESTDESSLASALRGTAARIEDHYGVSVDVVSVGDLPFDDQVRAVVAAAGEAVTNAAKHAGVDRVDVYAEVGTETVDVFVRDRGRGFDDAETPADRRGISDSIVARMERHGGTAQVTSSPGDGTEVRLHLPTPRSPRTPGQEAPRG